MILIVPKKPKLLQITIIYKSLKRQGGPQYHYYHNTNKTVINKFKTTHRLDFCAVASEVILIIIIALSILVIC